jgi:hypothetical protein
MEIQGADLGYFGNIWVRQNLLPKAGNSTTGHKHKFDHVSIITQGSVEVEIEGYPVKTFSAPRFIVIRKEYNHKFTALEDNTTWYCVFALRDFEGEPIEELFDLERHDPAPDLCVRNDYWVRASALDEKTTEKPSE